MISIVTPVLNGAKFIEKNIQSIQKLSIPFEHIIVDGGSTDDTLNIVQKYSHLKVFNQTEKTGMYGGIDMGFKNSKGKYLGWVNCDDFIIPENFESMYRVAISKDWDLVNSDSSHFYLNEGYIKTIKGSKYSKYFLKKGIFPFVQPSSLFKSDLYRDVGGFNLKYKIAGDMDLYYRMSLLKDLKIGYLPIKTTVFLKYGDSLGDQNSDKARSERLEANIPNPSFYTRLAYRISKIL